MALFLTAMCSLVCIPLMHGEAVTTTLPPPHTRPNLPLDHPFIITCNSDYSVTIQKDANCKKDMFVSGDVETSSCPEHNKLFSIAAASVTLAAGCKDKTRDVFLVETQNQVTPTVFGGGSAEVYWVSCDADKNGDPEHLVMNNPPNVQPSAVGLVLPEMKIGFFKKGSMNKNITGATEMKKLIIGQDVYLVIYNNRMKNHGPNKASGMAYMLIPKSCSAYPNLQQPRPSISLFTDDIGSTGCKTVDSLISSFTVKRLLDADVAYATIHAFKFQGHVDNEVVVECMVFICPTGSERTDYCNATRTSNCVFINDYMHSRRRRDAGLPLKAADVKTATLRATFFIEERPWSNAPVMSVSMSNVAVIAIYTLLITWIAPI